MKKVCLLAFVLFTWSIVVNAQESDGRYVEVTGSSEIEVVPDEIHFLVQIKEYWQEEYTGKSKKEEDFHTKVYDNNLIWLKDSVWTYYNEDGSIQKREKYSKVK